MPSPAPRTPVVCVLAPLAFLHRSGIGRYQTELVRGLSTRIPLHVMLHRRAWANPPEGGIPAPIASSTLHLYDDPGFALRHAPQLAVRLLLSPDIIDPHPRAFMAGVATRLLQGLAVDKQGIDLIHATMNTMPRTWGKAKRVVTVLDTIPLDKPQDVQRTTRRQFLKPRELRDEDFVVFISKATEAAFLRHFDHPAERRRVLYLGIDHQSFRPQQSAPPAVPAAPYIVTVGMFEPRKNLHRALSAFEGLAKDHPELRWRLTGAPGFGREEFLKALERSPARGQVDIADVHGDAALADLYRNAAALLFPSLEEGFGFPVAEALACGTPVAASKLDAVVEVGGDAFVPIDPQSVDSIREAVEKAAFDEAGKAARRARGIAHVQQFQWSANVQGHLDLYAESLGRPVADLLSPTSPPSPAN